MGVFNIIWGSIPVVVLLSMYFNCRYMIKGDKNILIGVTIPFLELKNEKVLDIVKEFKKENIKGFIIAAILFIPSFFFKLNSNQILYFFLWLIGVYIFTRSLFIKYNKRLMDLKRENNWLLPSKRLVTIDTEVTRLKDKMPVSVLWFIPSFIISLFPIIIVFNNIKEYGVSLGIAASNALIGNIIFLVMYKVYSKGKTEVISEDTNANIAYNTVFKRTWTMGTIIAATIQSIGMSFMFSLFLNNNNSKILFILSVIIPSSIILFGIFYINNKIKEEQGKILNTCTNPIYTDNDEFWSKGVYNNPNDRSVTVEDRAGYGITYNLGTKKGRRIYYGSLIFAGILVIGITGSLIRIDHSSFTLNIKNNFVKINAPTYGTEFNIDDIEEITMLDRLPSGIRTNGVGASTYNLGNFSIDGYGKCKLYLYFENQNCISIKLKDGRYIFFNSKSNDETLRYYAELQKLLEK